MALVLRGFRRKTNLNGLKCPYCGNDNLRVFIDFKMGKKNGAHFAKCLMVFKKSHFIRLTDKDNTQGCGKIFKLKY